VEGRGGRHDRAEMGEEVAVAVEGRGGRHDRAELWDWIWVRLCVAAEWVERSTVV
jgi:hypothetical protein